MPLRRPHCAAADRCGSEKSLARRSLDSTRHANKTRVRCPTCHNPIQLSDEQSDEVLCPGCGSCFRLRDAHPTSTTASMRPLGKFELLERVGLGAFGAVWRARDPKASVRNVAFAPNGKTLATGCWRFTKTGESGDLGGEVKIWDVATGEEKQTLREKLAPVTSLAFSPDGQTLAVGLLHRENVKLKERGGFEPPPESQSGVVVLCELHKHKR